MYTALPLAVAGLLRQQHGVITRAQIRSMGYADSTLRNWRCRGFLTRLHAGAFAQTDTWTGADGRIQLKMRLLATQLMAPDAIAFGTTAAVVQNLPVRTTPLRPLVARAPNTPRLSHADVTRRLIPVADVITIGGLLTTSTKELWSTWPHGEPLPDALIPLDAALRCGVDPRQLSDLLSDRADFPGAARARTTLNAGNSRAESPLESLSRGRMIERNMPLPWCNVVIRHRGRWVRVDFLWPDLGVVGECDGKVKYGQLDPSGTALWREKRRGEWIEDIGFELARWGYPEVAHDGAVMEVRFRRAAQRQRRAEWSLPGDVIVERPKADSCQFDPSWGPVFGSNPPLAGAAG